MYTHECIFLCTLRRTRDTCAVLFALKTKALEAQESG